MEDNQQQIIEQFIRWYYITSSSRSYHKLGDFVIAMNQPQLKTPPPSTVDPFSMPFNPSYGEIESEL